MITALVSRKGGVGKTTTAVNLAAALAGIGKRVLLVDLDSQASASLSLGVPRDYLVPSIADVLLQSRPLQDTVRSTRTLGLDLVTASTDLMNADAELAFLPAKERLLKRALEPLVDRYDHVFIDCPPSIAVLQHNALVAADTFIVPTVPHFLSLAGLEGLMAAVERMQDRFGVRPRLLGVVLTQVDYRTKAGRENAHRVRSELGDRVLAVEIRTNVRLAEAPAAGQTIFEHDDKSSGAKAYRLLAAEVLMRARRLAAGADLDGEPAERRPEIRRGQLSLVNGRR